MSRPLVMLFGGQSSRDEEMFDRLEAVDGEAAARARARAARRVEGDVTDFATNVTIQVSVCAVTLGWLEAVGRRSLVSTASAGLSLGEYAHLVDIGALEAEDTLDLVAERGRLYDSGPDGCMAAIFPVRWEQLESEVARVAEAHGGDAALAPAVFNSPSQTVVAGSRTAVEALIEAADQEFYAQGMVIENCIPMHTPRFRPVAPRLAWALEAAPWRQGRADYWPNVTAQAERPSPERCTHLLTRHVHEPVRWRHTVDALVARYPDAVFLEVGPRTVLRDLMARRWHSDVPVFAVDPVDAPPEDRSAVTEDTLMEVARALA